MRPSSLRDYCLFFLSLSFNIFLSLLLAPTIGENWKADFIPPSFLNIHLIGNAKLDGATDKRLKNLIWDSRVRTRAGSCARKRETTERRRRAVTLLEREKLKPVDQQSEWAAAAQASCRSSRRGFAEMRRNRSSPFVRERKKKVKNTWIPSRQEWLLEGRCFIRIEMRGENKNVSRGFVSSYFFADEPPTDREPIE